MTTEYFPPDDPGAIAEEIRAAAWAPRRHAALAARNRHLREVVDQAYRLCLPRTELPARLARFPILGRGPLRHVVLRAFEWYRPRHVAADLALVACLKEVAEVNQELVAQLDRVEAELRAMRRRAGPAAEGTDQG